MDAGDFGGDRGHLLTVFTPSSQGPCLSQSIPRMSAAVDMKAAKPGFEEAGETKTYPIRITLSSTKVKAVEQAVRDVISQAQKKNVKVSGPARIPTKTLRITTRKTPCGEGSKTWDRYEMRIHKRVIDLTSNMAAMKEIVQTSLLLAYEMLIMFYFCRLPLRLSLVLMLRLPLLINK